MIGRLFCWMGWHRPTDRIGVYGVSACSTCRRCGRMILQDSSGGWF